MCDNQTTMHNENTPRTDIYDAVKSAQQRILPQAVALRHHLHQYPELSGSEAQTAAHVAAQLAPLSLTSVQTDLGGHGVVATLEGAHPGPTIALRADMDALPICEQGDLPYKSRADGIMHACGHDGHTACLWGAASVLASLREHIHGTIKLVFQPAEETTGGAEALCALGVMDNVQAIFALHGWPALPVGQIGIRPGPMMASADRFDIILRGRGGHAAYPHLCVDPIAAGAQLVQTLQTIASREVSPLEPVVVTIAQFHAGTAFNIIPGEAHLAGTVRCLSNEVRETMPAVMERITAGVCAATRCEYDFSYVPGPPVVVNDLALTTFVEDTGRQVVGRDNVRLLDTPSMGAEDFAYYLAHAPGAFLRLGVGIDVTPLHTPTFNFSDAALPFGIETLAALALGYGARHSA